MWGKIIGSFAGFAFGGPFGALMGVAAGHAVDRMRDQADDDAQPPPLGGGDRAREFPRLDRNAAFSVAVIVLGAKIAKVDGPVTRAEITAFKQVFQAPPSEISQVARVFDAAKKDAGGYESYARQIAILFRHEPRVLDEVLAGLAHIARADGPVNGAELAFLRRVADLFGMDAARFEAVRSRFAAAPSNLSDPYAALGLNAKASDDEVRRNYRRLIREHHPDAVVAKGGSGLTLERANDRMAQINAAYDQIAKQRGMK